MEGAAISGAQRGGGGGEQGGVGSRRGAFARGPKRLSSDLEQGGGGEDEGRGGEEGSGERGPGNAKRRLVAEILKSTPYSCFI
jgi:hypothetical protein